ncbi:MAG: hypothetical protein PHV28_04205 [Kiritimatiellae bacterium]|nr:hypothetical protein [Kiritimatiellia bacterium]
MRTRSGAGRSWQGCPAACGAALLVVLGLAAQAAAQAVTPANVAAEAAVACANAAFSGVSWSAGFVSNVAEVTFGETSTDRVLGLSCVSVDGTVATGSSPTGMIAWSEARFDASAVGTLVEIGRVSGGIHATGLTNAFGILAWSETAYATNPAAVRVGTLDGTVSANVKPGGAVAAAVCARTSVELTLASGAVVFGGTCGWDAGDGSATNAAEVLRALLSKVKARTATAAESNALVSASSEGYAVLGGTGSDRVCFASENVAVFGKVALGGGYDTVTLAGIASGKSLTLPPVTGAELLAVTNCPDVAVSNAAVFAELYVGSNALCRLKDPAYTVAGLYGSGTVAPLGMLAVTNRIEVGRFGGAPTGSALTVTGNLTLGAGLTCALRAAETAGVWANDTVAVSGALTVAGGGTVDLGCTAAAPFALNTRRVVMTAAGGIVNPAALAGWTLAGTGRDSETRLLRIVRAEGNSVVVVMARRGMMISIR